MKNLLLTTVVILSFATIGCSQKSPKREAKGKVNGVSVEIVYSSPSARGRTIMGELVPYNKVWRTGANAATTIEINKDAKFEGNSVAAGKYSLYTIPGKKEWTIIINRKTGQSGTEYDESSDAIRFKVKPEKTDAFVESFVISVEKKGVKMAWENTSVSFDMK